jgi:hypothetical protein
MSLTDTETDLPLTPERPSQRSLDPTQPTAEERAAQEQMLRARGPQPTPPQQGPGIAFPRLGPTNPAQVASLQPSIPQTPMPGVPTEEPGQDKKIDSLDPRITHPEETATGTADQPIVSDISQPVPNYDLNAPATYRPPSPNREPSQWGDDWFPTKAAESYPGVAPGPDMPSPQEAYPNAADASRRLAHLSDGPIAEAHMRANLLMNPLAAVADAFSQGRFSRNFSASYLRGLQIQQEEALTELYLANQAQKKFLSGLGGIVEMSRGPNPLLNEQQAKDAIRNYLIENHHQSWVPFLDSHNIAGIARLAQIQDAQLRRSEASGVTIRKAMDIEGQDAVLRGWGINTGGTGGTGGLPGDQPGKTEAEETGPPLRGELAPFNQLSADQKQAAYDLFNHRAPSKDLNLLISAGGTRGKEAVGQIFQFARALDARANRIAAYQDPKADPRELSQRKLDALRQMNPEYAHTVEGLHNLEIDPKSEQMKDRIKVINTVGQVFPGWNEGMYHSYWQNWANAKSPQYISMQAANRLTSSLITAHRVVNLLPINEADSFPKTFWADLKAKGYTNDPRYGEANDVVATIAREAVIAQGRGQPAVAYVKQIMQGMPLTGGKAQLRAVIRDLAIGTHNIIRDNTIEFKKQTGLDRPPPGYSDRAEAVYQGIIRGNPYRGVFDANAPQELKNVSVPNISPPEQRAKKPPWMTPDLSYEPLTQEDYDAKMDWLKKNPNHPMAPAVSHELGIAGQ